LPVSASDVRLVLEANVRATQLAFSHNERTLAASLRMAETLRDGLLDLANAQASWITAIASARGFFRNASPALPMHTASLSTEDEEADEDDDAPTQPAWIEMAQPLVATITESVVKAIVNRGPKNDGAKGFELRDALDWRRAAKKADGNALAGGEAPASIENVSERLQRKAMDVFALLDKPEQARLLALVPKLAGRAGDPEMQRLAAELLPLPPDEAAAWVRAHLDDIERRFASLTATRDGCRCSRPTPRPRARSWRVRPRSWTRSSRRCGGVRHSSRSSARDEREQRCHRRWRACSTASRVRSRTGSPRSAQRFPTRFASDCA
jgi:hypothetical protein